MPWFYYCILLSTDYKNIPPDFAKSGFDLLSNKSNSAKDEQAVENCIATLVQGLQSDSDKSNCDDPVYLNQIVKMHTIYFQIEEVTDAMKTKQHQHVMKLKIHELYTKVKILEKQKRGKTDSKAFRIFIIKSTHQKNSACAEK